MKMSNIAVKMSNVERQFKVNYRGSCVFIINFKTFSKTFGPFVHSFQNGNLLIRMWNDDILMTSCFIASFKHMKQINTKT